MNTKRALDILSESESKPQQSDENKFYGFWGLVAAPLFGLGWLTVFFHLGAYVADAYRHFVNCLGF